MFLIIGASGLIGNHIYNRCLKISKTVVGTSTTGIQDGMIKYRIGSDDPEELLGVFSGHAKENNYAIIAGAITNLNDCFYNQTESEKVNINGTMELIKVLDENDVKVVFLSSDCVFDGMSGNYTEKDSTNPICVYGKQKEKIEKFVLREIPEGVIFRISKQFDVTMDKRHLFSDLYRSMQEKKIRCIDGLIFNPTYVEDTAECIIKGCDAQIKGLYNLAAPESFERYTLAEMFVDIMNAKDVEITRENEGNFHFPEPRALNMSMQTRKFSIDIGHKFKDVESMMYIFRDYVRKEDRR